MRSTMDPERAQTMTARITVPLHTNANAVRSALIGPRFDLTLMMAQVANSDTHPGIEVPCSSE